MPVQGEAAPRALILIGGSAGAHAPLREILGPLDRTVEAAVLVTIHIPPDSGGGLAHVVTRWTTLDVVVPTQPTMLHAGRVYLAPPDHHLVDARAG